jgi:hypothetical protein
LLIADALVSRGWTVQHILSASSLQLHALTPFAKWEDGRLTYPAEHSKADSSDLTFSLF